jgi:uncharacterized protein (DUF1697 family)
LLRGVNVGKHNRIAMADLRRVLEGVGARDVTTYLQSGNAVVTTEDPDLAGRVERALRDEVGLSVRVLTRTAEQLRSVVDRNPFPHKVSEPKLLHVAFLEHPVDPAVTETFPTRQGDDEYAPGDGVLYLSYSARSFDSPLNAVLSKLDGVATTRNWTTVTKLLDLAER